MSWWKSLAVEAVSRYRIQTVTGRGHHPENFDIKIVRAIRIRFERSTFLALEGAFDKSNATRVVYDAKDRGGPVYFTEAILMVC